MTTLNKDEQVKLVTDTLGVGMSVEVYQGLSGKDKDLDENLDTASTLLSVHECKEQFWKQERGSPEAHACIRLIAKAILRGPYYTPRPLGIGVKASLEVYK